MKIWTPSTKEQRPSEKNYMKRQYELFGTIYLYHQIITIVLETSAHSLSFYSFITSNASIKSPVPYYHVVLCTQFFSDIYVTISMASIIMNFIALIVNWMCYELIVFDCKLITSWTDCIDCIMTAIIFKLDYNILHLLYELHSLRS